MNSPLTLNLMCSFKCMPRSIRPELCMRIIYSQCTMYTVVLEPRLGHITERVRKTLFWHGLLISADSLASYGPMAWTCLNMSRDRTGWLCGPVVSARNLP